STGSVTREASRPASSGPASRDDGAADTPSRDTDPPSSIAEARAARIPAAAAVVAQPRRLAGSRRTDAIAERAASTASGTPGSASRSGQPPAARSCEVFTTPTVTTHGDTRAGRVPYARYSGDYRDM